MNVADTAITVVDRVGAAARFISKIGKPALPFIEFAAAFVPGAEPVVKVLELAAPVIDKIALSAPIIEQALKDGKPAIDALQAASPDLLHSFKELYAIAASNDPTVGQTIVPAQVSDHTALHFAAPVLIGRRWTDDEMERWWDRDKIH